MFDSNKLNKIAKPRSENAIRLAKERKLKRNTMNTYTIYCTNEQTKKALELGAPIVQYKAVYISENTPHCVEYKDDVRVITTYPTAEQIICWLEEQGIFIHLNYIATYGYSSWLTSIQDGKHLSENLGYVDTHKKAILNAIDFALNYLYSQNIKTNTNN